MKSDGEVRTTIGIIDLHYISVNQVRLGNAKQIYHFSYNFLPLDFPETAKTQNKSPGKGHVKELTAEFSPF